MIKKQYIAPSLTSVEFKTERGYAASNVNVALGNLADAANHFIEARTDEGDLWGADFTSTNINPNTIEPRSNQGNMTGGGWLTNDAGNYL